MASNSKLLKMARARDDQDLVLRVAAALTIQAQKVKGWDLAPDTRTFVEWILANPMEQVTRALSFIVANPTVAEKITLTEGVISSEAVTDDEILYVIEQSFDALATSVRQYGTK